MADRCKIRRGLKSKCDLAQYEIGYLIDERRICIADGNSVITFVREDELEALKARVAALESR